MKRLKSITKILLKGLLIVVLTCLFVLPNTGCFVDGRFLNGSININLYTNASQMNRLLTDLHCDRSSMIAENGSIIRLAHNNGEPIYVSFDDSVDNTMREYCLKSLDYIFGLVGEINAYYYYEVVDLDKYVSTKSHITYSMYNENESNIKNASAYVERFSNNSYYTTSDVYINDHLTARSPKYINYVLTHELLHIFGFEDVYVAGQVKNTNDYFDNTFLNVSDIYINSGMISPNDYKFLLSAYTTKQAFSSYNNTILEYSKLLDDYSTRFFNAIASNSLNGKVDNMIDTVGLNSIELTSSDDEKYILTSNGDDYLMTIVSNGVIEESLTGKIKYVELDDIGTTVAVLTDVNSKCLSKTGMFSNSEAVHTNLFLYNRLGSNQQNEYCLTKLSGGQLMKSI